MEENGRVQAVATRQAAACRPGGSAGRGKQRGSGRERVALRIGPGMVGGIMAGPTARAP